MIPLMLNPAIPPPINDEIDSLDHMNPRRMFGRTTLVFVVLAVGALPLPASNARPEVLARARHWTELEADQVLDLIDELRDEEVSRLVQEGPDRVVPLVTLYFEDYPSEAASLLPPLLSHSNASAGRVCSIVARIGDMATAEQILQLESPSGGLLRREQLEALVATNPEGTEELLLDWLEEAESPAERSVVLTGLAQVATESSLETLIAMLDEPAWNVRRLAARGLAHAGLPSAAEAVQEALAKETEDAARRELKLAWGALGGHPATLELTNCLAQPLRRSERALCLDALALSPDLDAVKALVGVLSTDTSDLRREAAMALGTRSEELARTALLDTFLEEESPNVFRFEAASLGRLGAQRAAPRLREALEDPNVAYFAAVALAELGDPSGVEILHIALKDHEYREQALRSLHQVGDPRSIEPVSRVFIQTRDLWTKAAALRTLKSVRAR